MTRDELLHVAATLASGTNHDAKSAVAKARELIQAVDDEVRNNKPAERSEQPVALREPAVTSKPEVTSEPVRTKTKEGR